MTAGTQPTYEAIAAACDALCIDRRELPLVTKEELRKAFLASVKPYHPDTLGPDPLPEILDIAETATRQATEAYHLLKPHVLSDVEIGIAKEMVSLCRIAQYSDRTQQIYTLSYIVDFYGKYPGTIHGSVNEVLKLTQTLMDQQPKLTAAFLDPQGKGMDYIKSSSATGTILKAISLAILRQQTTLPEHWNEGIDNPAILKHFKFLGASRSQPTTATKQLRIASQA